MRQCNLVGFHRLVAVCMETEWRLGGSLVAAQWPLTGRLMTPEAAGLSMKLMFLF
ncbi:MAG: hypothetical protein JWQ10_155 [Herbaspirillum sp.]|nr:hypothetical protein [Herbaspirillum sp.]